MRLEVKTVIKVEEKYKCCGCSACANICPMQCISMQEDEEGFLYPSINKEKCINCNECENVCPVLNQKEEKITDQFGYIVQIKDEKIRQESTSGGAFTAIAQHVIKNGGVVFGVCYNRDFQVMHDYVERKEELGKFRNSKYVQSEIRNTFQQAKHFLDEGRFVCFSGTPCQIEGLKRYLKKEYENLITVDVVCRAVASPLVWKKYLNMQKKKCFGEIKKILFRDKKKYGYQYSTMSIYGENNKLLYCNGIDTDKMLRSFFSNICNRPSCYQCRFKKRYRESDFTIWDCFIVSKFESSMDDNKGTTRLLIHNSKGKEVFKELKKGLISKEVNADILVKDIKEMFTSVSMNPKRREFFEMAENREDLFEEFFPVGCMNYLEKNMRKICCCLGIYRYMKKVYGCFLK